MEDKTRIVTVTTSTNIVLEVLPISIKEKKGLRLRKEKQNFKFYKKQYVNINPKVY